jgi:hypothetical protein
MLVFALFNYGAGLEPSSLSLRPLIAVLCRSWMIDASGCGAVSEMNECQVEPKYSEKTWPSVALSTTDPT